MDNKVIERVLAGETIKPKLAIEALNDVLDQLGKGPDAKMDMVVGKLQTMLPGNTVEQLRRIRARKEVLEARKDKVERRLLAEAGRIAGEMALLVDSRNFSIGKNKLPWPMPGEKADIFHYARERALENGHNFVDDERQILEDRKAVLK